MNADTQLDLFLETLLEGDRPTARRMVQETLDAGWAPDELVTDLYWPVYERLERLFRSDHVSRMSYRIATRLLRMLVDQTSSRLEAKPSLGRRVLCVSGPSETDELGAQMAVDLLEAGGLAVTYAGGDIPADEIMTHLHRHTPDALVLFAAGPSDLPEFRQMIDRLHEIGACPGLQIVVGGGVFNRAEGLAEEIGADLWASDPLDLVELMTEHPERRAAPDQRTVGRSRKKAA